jgi:hypothetical protein
MVAEMAVHDDGVAGPGVARRDVHTVRHDADAGGVDEQFVRRAAFDDLGVAGDDGDAGSCAGASCWATRRSTWRRPSSTITAQRA